MLAKPEALAAALQELAESGGGALSLPLLEPRERRRLLAAARRLPYRPARAVIGEGDKAVRQDFALCERILPNGSIVRFAAVLEQLLTAALARLPHPPLEAPLRLNDWIAQRYEAGSQGISPHRDHLRYRGLVLLVTLSGSAPLFLCRDRSGAGAEPVDAAPGRLVLLRAPGFAGSQERPFHALGQVTRRRYSLGIRHDATKP